MHFTTPATLAVMIYRPNGQRWLGRPLKRLLVEAETGLSRSNDDDDDDDD